MPRVNPAILSWARETAGLSPDEAVEKLQLRSAHGVSAVDRLAALESGDVAPTRAMLRKMSERYRRPLIVFYMSAPPRRGDRGEDFRTLPEEPATANEALLDALLRDLKARQALVRAVMEDEDEAVELRFVGSADSADGIDVVVNSLRDTLALPLEEFRQAEGPDAAFQLLRGHAERIGVYVLLIGDLGSHHSALGTETFRGFAIADPIAPFVVINDKDARAAWSFTLLHELAHIWLGQTGVSGDSLDQSIERFCNDVASEYLLPSQEVEQHSWRDLQVADTASTVISDFASDRNVSRQMVAYRLYRAGLITVGMWQSLRSTFHQEWLQERIRRREEDQESDGGPSYYVVRRHRIGKALIDLTARMLASGALTTSKAGKILGVRPANVATLIGGSQYWPRAS